MVKPSAALNSMASGIAACVLILLVGAVSPVRGQAPGLDGDEFASHLVGNWSGSGLYDGNRLELTRSWSLELGSKFLKADMAVSMPNGASFGALMYWKSAGQGSYEVIWLDGTGRMQRLQAESDAQSSVVRAEYVDEFTERGPETRRWEYVRTGPDSYVERLLRLSDGEWALLTEWTFSRID